MRQGSYADSFIRLLNDVDVFAFSATLRVTWVVLTLRWMQSQMENGSAPTVSKIQVHLLACPGRKARLRRRKFTTRQVQERKEKDL